MAPFMLQASFMVLVAALQLGLSSRHPSRYRWRGGWRLIAGVPFLAVCVVAAKIVVDVNADPTAHNLWPFELLGAVGIAGVVLGGIRLLRFIALGWGGREESR